MAIRQQRRKTHNYRVCKRSQFSIEIQETPSTLSDNLSTTDTLLNMQISTELNHLFIMFVLQTGHCRLRRSQVSMHWL